MFRLAIASDARRLTEIFSQSVFKLAPSLYTSKQVKAWGTAMNDQTKMLKFITEAKTYLIIDNEITIGFCTLKSDGHIASFYIDADYTRKGYGTKLLKYVLQQGIEQGMKRFYTEASFFSHPVFLRCGFEVVTMETVDYNHVLFRRYKMAKIVK